MPAVNATTSTPTLFPGIDFIAIFRAMFEGASPGGWDSFVAKIETWWTIYSIIAILFSLLFFAIFIYSKIRLTQLYEIQDQNIKEEEALWAAQNNPAGTGNKRWENIKLKVTDNNPESWRIAIIEADIMLDETLKNAGYVGQSIGDKLKTANPESFRTVQDAWDAHKVRNDIAHVGSDFILTQKTAQETLTRFERVFREFDVI